MMPRAFSHIELYSIVRCTVRALALLALAGSCGRPHSRDRFANDTTNQLSTDPFADDTTYQRRLAYQQQMSYKVPIDSTMHLYERLASAPRAQIAAIAREFTCEGMRSATRYGAIPSAAAQLRGMDSLKRAKPEVFARATDVFDHVSPLDLSVTSATCHLLGITPAPESLNVNPTPEAVRRKRQVP